MPFLVTEAGGPAELVQRLRHNRWWGQVVGPHGSGKSALLAAVRPLVEQAGRKTFLVELHDAQRRLPIRPQHTPELDSAALLIVDGYEQLGRFARYRLVRFCRRGGPGLLVTSHAPVGLPELCRTAVDLQLARRIVEQLICGYPPHVTGEDVAGPFQRHAGNLREVLFELYDLYQHRRGGN